MSEELKQDLPGQTEAAQPGSEGGTAADHTG